MSSDDVVVGSYTFSRTSVYVRAPTLMAILSASFIFGGVICAMVQSNFNEFYFTYVYEFPSGEPLQIISAALFLSGYIGMLGFLAAALHAEFMIGEYNVWVRHRYHRLAIYISGIFMFIAAGLLVPFPRILIMPHRVIAFCSLATMFLHLFIRLAWWTIFPILISIPAFLMYSSDSLFLFSIGEIALDASLYICIFLDLLFPNQLRRVSQSEKKTKAGKRGKKVFP